MLELVALAVTLGAVLAHNFEVETFTAGLVGISFAFFGCILLRSLRGALFSFLLAGAFVLGACAVDLQTEMQVKSERGARTFTAEVVSVNRKLVGGAIIVRVEGTKEKLQLFQYDSFGFLPGDRLTVKANIEAPEAFLTDAGRLFDYPLYLESRGIGAIGRDAAINRIETGNVSLQRVATILRFKIADTLARYVTFPIDGIIAGMTVGYQGGIPEDIQNLFRNTGVLHVLVLSGYNITLLAGAVGMVLRGLPFRVRTLLSIAAIALLVVISGSGVAAVRAGIMGGIALVAGLAIRTYQPLRALTLALLFFFFSSPNTLFSDPGFHLSFLATAFMIFGVPKIEPLFSFIPKTKYVNLRELFALAVTIPVFMLPYTMYFSGLFALSSPVANIVLSIVGPLLMLIGIAVIACAWLTPVAFFMGTVAGRIGEIVLEILKECATLPVWHTPEVPWWSITLCYFVFFLFLYNKEIKRYLLRLQNLFALPAN